MQILNFAKTRKFWTALAGGVVTFLTIMFNSPEWLSSVTLLLTALGVYRAPNAK
jgi:hypothetical protein